ncbi:ATP-binding protein [Pseudomonas vranovensis]|uniref:ATP-binding protein n=2 Tax=Pseudomonas vranovensis TaxID=321661 RepID=UPI003D978730
MFAEGGDLHEYSTHDPQTRIAVANDAALRLFRQNGGEGIIIRHASPLAAMASVLTGDADVYLGDTFSTSYLSSQLFSNQLEVNQSTRLPEVRVGFAIAENNRRLADLFERALAGISRCQMADTQYAWGDIEGCEVSGFLDRLTDTERSWLDQAGMVKLAISEDLAPYAFFNSHGRLNGIASDLLDIIRRKTDIRFQIIRVSSLSEVDALLASGDADLGILTEVSHAPLLYLHTRSLASAPYLFVMRNEDQALLDEQSSATVAVAKGYLLSPILARHYRHVRIEETDTMGEAFKLVREGRAHFVLAPANVARYYLSYKYESSLKVGGIVNIQNANVVFANPGNHPQLISIFDKVLAEIPPREFLQITGRWRANSATDEKYWEGIASYIWRSFEVLGALLLVAGLLILVQRGRIRRKRLDLEQRQLLLDELQVAKDSAEKASRSKSVFLATMSHEIRTPLNAILGMLELVLTRKDNTDLNKQSVHIAYDSATHLLALIGDILDISRIESEKLTLVPEPARIRDLLESTTNVFSGLARQKQLSLSLETDPLATELVWVDALKLKQIISNLLSNAVKFTDSGGIDVRCRVSATGENTLSVAISVSDTGIGIAAAQIDQVFKPFYITSEAVSNPNAGAGLGLAISKALSELMNGRLEVESETAVGTRITLRLALERVSGENAAINADDPMPANRSDDAQLTVLIVEDHLPSQYLLYQQVSYLGHRAMTASNGLEGLAMWQENLVDIVLTDCNMPESSGYEMTQSIRRLEQAHGLRPCLIIGLTADAQREALERCLAAGMDHSLAKPVTLATLNRWISKRDSEHQRTSEVTSPINDIQAALAVQIIQSNDSEHTALQKALQENDPGQVRRIAHKLKGTAYLLNHSELLELCAEVEDLCTKGQLTGDVVEAVSALMQTLEGISRSLGSDPPAMAAPGNISDP